MKNTLNNEAPISFKKSSKLLDNNEINKYINRSKKKKCTICPYNFSLSSSVQSTLNTINTMSQKDNSKLNKFFKDLSLTNSNRRNNDMCKTIRRLTRPKTDDMKILYKIFFNYEAGSTIKYLSFNMKKINNKNNNKDNYDQKLLRNYIIKIQTEFNEGGDILIAKTNKNIPFLIDFYIMKKLEDLIARYSLIIFLFLKLKNVIEAKKIFLLMIQENIRYFNYIENKIIYNFNTKDKNNNIQPKDNYKMISQLIKIYSFIIRYSQLFNTMNNRNKFVAKYFRIINLNYHYILNLANFHSLNNEIKNQLTYWFSFYLSYINYFSILNYSPFSIPITLNNIILSLYKNIDENILTTLERKLILNTRYNQGLLLYVNNKRDEALFNLKQAEQKMKILENKPKIAKKDIHASQNRNGIFASNNSLKIIPYFEIKEKKKKLSYKSNIPIQLLKKSKLLEQNGFFTGKTIDLMKSMKAVKSGYSNYLYEDIENICKNFVKSNVNLSHITLLIEFGIENGKLNFKEINEFDKSIFSLFQKSETTLSSNSIRNSQIISSRRKTQEFQFPQYLIDPLFFKIELLIGEIYINKKNIKEAYEHVLKSLYLLILFKFYKPSELPDEYTENQKIIIGYLKLIDELCDEKILESNQNEDESQTNSNGQTIFNINSNKNENKYNYNNNIFEENKKNNNEETIVKEFEKFFIFLSSLSVYQTKVLNETQPQNEKRNDLPIFFSTQFKDCLSTLQRLQLDKLQTMALSRFIILRNPNRWIIPSNLNTNLLNSVQNNINYNNINSKMTLKYFTNIKGLKIYSLKSNKREYNYYKKILISKKVNDKMRDFLNNNIEYALKILKKSTDEEIKYMINHPILLLNPIKKYKKSFEKKVKCKSQKQIHSMIIFDNIDNGNKNIPRIDLRKSSKPSSDRYLINTVLSDKVVSNEKKKFFIEKKITKSRRRNKSTGNFLIKPNIINKINQCYFINDAKGTKDYNDSFEDYKLSIDCSFYDDGKKI